MKIQHSLVTLLVATVAFAALVTFPNQLAAQDGATRSGTFTGKSDHVTKGGVTIEKTASGYVVVLGDDFSLDGAPDPKVGLGKNGYKKSAKLGKLTKNKGKQTYEIPAGLNPDDFNEVWIWCEKFSVGLGVAKLS